MVGYDLENDSGFRAKDFREGDEVQVLSYKSSLWFGDVTPTNEAVRELECKRHSRAAGSVLKVRRIDRRPDEGESILLFRYEDGSFFEDFGWHYPQHLVHLSPREAPETTLL